jgi:hypothetical protein
MSHPEPENIFDSLENCVAFHCQEWGSEKRNAWIFGIVCGWDEEAMIIIADKHRWKPHDVERLKRLRAQFEQLKHAFKEKTCQTS